MPIPVSICLLDSTHSTVEEAAAVSLTPGSTTPTLHSPLGPVVCWGNPCCSAQHSWGRAQDIAPSRKVTWKRTEERTMVTCPGLVWPKAQLKLLLKPEKTDGKRAKPPSLAPAGTLETTDQWSLTCGNATAGLGHWVLTGMLPSQIALFTCSALGKPKSPFHLPGNSTIVNKCKRLHLCFLHDPAF